MPIRFRCVYCNQLLGIARRKAGSVVRCTKCDGKIIVPQPDDAMPATHRKLDLASTQPGDYGPQLFERNDFDDLLRPIDDSKENDFQFEKVASNAEPELPMVGSDTANFRALAASDGGKLFTGKPWLIIAMAVALALGFLVLGYVVGRIT